MVITAHIVFSLCLTCIVKLCVPTHLICYTVFSVIPFKPVSITCLIFDSNMPAQRHAELEICDFNAKTREFILYDQRKIKACLFPTK